MPKNKQKKRKKNKHFCRLYKYTCACCGKEKHKRHYAKTGETICAICEKQNIIKNQPSLFETI